LPLIQVAWADGEVQASERALILRVASERFDLDEAGSELLDGWLTYPPTDGYLARGRQVLLALTAQQQEASLSAESLHDVVGMALDVAKSAGGFFGMRSVDAAERAALDELAKLLHVDPAASFQALMDLDIEDVTEEPTGVHRQTGEATVAYRPQAPTVGAQPCIVRSTLSGPVAYALRGERLQIGRARDNDVQVRHDHGVSRRHCALELGPDGWLVRDLGSANGTLVNGERVTTRRLLGGEELLVGGARFAYCAHGFEAPTVSHVADQVGPDDHDPLVDTVDLHDLLGSQAITLWDE
ncbi:MAG: putative tellurite resistance protein B-like protein, partial [Kiritimatiellia bacterium]